MAGLVFKIAGVIYEKHNIVYLDSLELHGLAILFPNSI